MTQYRIPNQGKASQPNKGDIAGSVSRSVNLDLRTNPGRVRVSPRLKVLTKDNDASITTLGLPIAFVNFSHTDGSIRTIMVTGIGTGTGSGGVFMSSNSDYGAFANLAGNYATNDPTTIGVNSDAIFWNGKLYVSVSTDIGADDIYELASDTWDTNWFTSDLSGTLGTDCLVAFGVGFNGNLYIIKNNNSTDGTLMSVTTAEVLNQTAINFMPRYRPIWIRSTSSRIWVAVMSWFANVTSKGEGYIAEWDATGTAPNKYHKIDAPCALSGCVYKDTLYIIDAYGILKRFTGYGFTEVARLPVANLNIEMPGIYSAQTHNRWIHHRGMEVVNDKINILVNNFVSTGVYVTEMPSGVWEFDPENPSLGLYHKSSPCSTTDDYGQQLLPSGGTGAIFPLKDTNGNYMAGVSYYTDDATTQRYAVFYDDVATNTNKRGSLTTTFLPAESAQDTFQDISYRFRALPSGDKIIGKSRTGKKANMPFIASITWTSTTTFTSTDSNFQYAVVGDEIEGMMGKGASTSAHISAISEAGGTYTVTLEEAIGFSSGTAKVKVDNFKKLGVISAQDTNQDNLVPMDTGAEIQVKTEMRFTGDIDLNDVTITSKGHKK